MTAKLEKAKEYEMVEDHQAGSRLKGSDTHVIAERGHLATDEHGQALLAFDRAAERRLRRKIDWYILPSVCFIYLFCFIDRASVGNAKIAGFEKDLNMHGYDYNRALTVFYVAYTVFEYPCNILCKFMGPGWFLPCSTLGFGICTIGMAFVNNIHSVYAVRFLLGLFEAGMLPGIAYYLSRWYRRSELTFRLAVYCAMTPLAGAFGGLLASAILTMDHFGSLHRWRMIFAIEGIITISIALVAFITVTDRPSSARWLSQEEKDLAIARVKSERIATTEILDKLDGKKVIRGALSPMTLVIAFSFLLVCISVQGLAVFLPTIVKSIYPTRSVVYQQLHTVPPYVVGLFTCLLIPYISYRIDRRQIFLAGSAVPVMLGYAMFIGTNQGDTNARYAATFLMASGIFIYGAMINAQVAANVVSDTSRASAIGMVAIFGNLGGLISTWSYLPFDAPNYHIGNGLNLSTSTALFLVSIVFYFYMKLDNRRRDRSRTSIQDKLAGLSYQQIQDLEWKHPGFRWKL